jgi:hypothetical protein
MLVTSPLPITAPATAAPAQPAELLAPGLGFHDLGS